MLGKIPRLYFLLKMFQCAFDLCDQHRTKFCGNWTEEGLIWTECKLSIPFLYIATALRFERVGKRLMSQIDTLTSWCQLLIVAILKYLTAKSTLTCEVCSSKRSEGVLRKLSMCFTYFSGFLYYSIEMAQRGKWS